MPIATKQELSKQPDLKSSKGSSILDLLAVIAITIALVGISYPIYNDYIDKAKITVAYDTLGTVRKALKQYHEKYQEYPGAPMDFFFTGIDSKKRTVFGSLLQDQINNNISPVSYRSTAVSYTLKVKAKDSKETIMTMTPVNISY